MEEERRDRLVEETNNNNNSFFCDGLDHERPITIHQLMLTYRNLKGNLVSGN